MCTTYVAAASLVHVRDTPEAAHVSGASRCRPWGADLSDIPAILSRLVRPLERPLREAGQPCPGNAQALWRLTLDHETCPQLDVSPSGKTTMAAERTKKE